MEKITSLGIINSYYQKLRNNLSVDAAIVGASPSALVTVYHLIKTNKKIALFKCKLASGGDMQGRGMTFNQVIVQKRILALLMEMISI